MKKKNELFLAVLSSMFLLVGCGNNAVDDPKKDNPTGEKTDDKGNEGGGNKDDGKDQQPEILYFSVNYAVGNYTGLQSFKDEACTQTITDGKVENGTNLFFKFSINTALYDIDSVTYNNGAADSINELSKNDGNYTYKVTNVKSNLVISIKTKDATPVTPVNPEGFKVAFDLKDHVKDLKVYKTEARAAADVDSGKEFYSRDDTSGEATKDGSGQINFEFKVDSGFQLKNISATSGYNKIKFLGIKNGVVSAKITKITADITVTIEAEGNTVVHEGYNVTLVKGEHVKDVKIYSNCGFVPGTEVSGLVTKSINEENGLPTTTKGRVYFTVEMEDGYEFGSVSFNPADSTATADVDKDIPNSHLIKNVDKDMTVTVLAKDTGGTVDPGTDPVEEGFNVTFNLVNLGGNSWQPVTHLQKPVVYTDKTLATVDAGETGGNQWNPTTTYKTRNGDNGSITKTDGQVNFTVDADEGYQIKSVSATAGAYKNIKFVPGKDGAKDSWRITKITSDITITIEAQEVTEGWPVEIAGAKAKVFSDETFATEVSDGALVAKDASGNPTKNDGSLYFQVEAPRGYKLGTADPVLAIDSSAKLEKVTVEGKENCYKLTKIACSTKVVFASERDTTVPYLYYKSTTKANTYTSGSNIAQNGDTYFVIGSDPSYCVIVWFWTYDGDATREEINIQIAYTFDGTTIDASAGNPIAQYNDDKTDRQEWQHVGNKKFVVEEITEMPAEFTHYLTLLTVQA